MRNKGWDITLAILWGLCLIINIYLWITGGTPNQAHIICAYIIIVHNYLERIVGD